MRQNKNTWFYMSGSGLDRIQFIRFRTGFGLKNFTVRSSLLHRRAGRQAALQDGPVVCTLRRAGGLHSKLGCEKGRPKDCPFLQPAQPLPQPAGPPFCAARRPALLCSPPKVHVFHSETRPSSPPGPPALQLVVSNHM